MVPGKQFNSSKLASGGAGTKATTPTKELDNTLPKKGNTFVRSLDDNKPKKAQRFFGNRSNDD